MNVDSLNMQNTYLPFSRINQVVERILTADYTPGSLLELGAGAGGLSIKLKEHGFDVTPTDFAPERFLAHGMQCKKADLDEPFPFDDNRFDYVVGVEVIEHLEKHFYFIQECCRVLIPGGILIITTPNLLSLASRLKYFFTGFYPLCQRPNNEFERIRLYQHINPINYYNLRYILHTNNFRIRRVAADRFRKSSLALAFCYPFLYVFTALTMKGEPDKRQVKVNKDVHKAILSPELLFGRTMIVIAQKIM